MKNFIKTNNDKYIYLSDYNQLMNSGVKDLFLEYAGEDRTITVQEVEVTESILQEKIKTIPQLILEISEGCNLRCKYCVYDGNYINERQLGTGTMDYDLAVKAIDYIYSIIKDRSRKHFAIGFYGGEPLINFKTIKQIVPYVEEKFDGWSLNFNMTTNMTLLTDEILEFFIQHNFSVLVSLDGDKDNHDAKRVFANGKGTFDVIMKNLEKIQKRDASFFKEMVSFSAVHSFDLSLLNLYRFFSEHPQFKNHRLRFSGVNTYNTTYYDQYPFDSERLNQEYREILGMVLDKVEKGEELAPFEDFLFTNISSFGDRLDTRGFSILFGTCMFDSRLYLDTSGNFHLCEKMNNRFPIGNIEDGFDYSRMKRYIHQYTQLMKTHCMNCDIRFLCSRCFVNFCGDGKFEINPEFCQNKRHSVQRSIEKYIECKERHLV